MTDDKSKRISANIIPRVPSETKLSSVQIDGKYNRTVSSPVLQTADATEVTEDVSGMVHF